MQGMSGCNEAGFLAATRGRMMPLTEMLALRPSTGPEKSTADGRRED